MNRIILTFDTDWVNEIAVEYVIDLLDTYGVTGTFFATNHYNCLKNNQKHEVGIHPNFNNLLNGSSKSTCSKSIINDMLVEYPESIGFRSHSLTQSSIILAEAKNSGLQYDSNIYHPDGGRPYIDFSGLIRFTHNYVDLGHLIEKRPFELSEIYFSDNEMNILDFHPIHIFLNTPSTSYYEGVKIHTKSHEFLRNNINTKEKGVGDLFIELLTFLKSNSIESYPLKYYREYNGKKH
jgi:hypothetical protein